ncbi:MAG: hypothetical protein ACC700_19975, partial [Anaerolineales bacterium]
MLLDKHGAGSHLPMLIERWRPRSIDRQTEWSLKGRRFIRRFRTEREEILAESIKKRRKEMKLRVSILIAVLAALGLSACTT